MTNTSQNSRNLSKNVNQKRKKIKNEEELNNIDND